MLSKFAFLLYLTFRVVPCFAQSPTGSSPSAPTQRAKTSEVSTRDESITFTSRVALIEVPVDKGNPQIISKFSVERSEDKPITRIVISNVERSTDAKPAPEGGVARAVDQSIIVPDHFIGLLFDDIHMDPGDLASTRKAAQTFITSGVTATDRIAIFTTSGQTTLDFTGDRELLLQTLLKIVRHPIEHTLKSCPDISAYQANLIINMHDPQALASAAAEAAGCYKVIQSQRCPARE